MDSIFLNELIIFLGVCALFIGTVPMLLKGHIAEPIEVASASAVASGDEGQVPVAAAAGHDGDVQVRVSRKRRAQARDGAKRKKR